MNPVRELFHAWERRLAFRDDPERRVLSFDWGLEHLPEFPRWNQAVPVASPLEAGAAIHGHVERALEFSDVYFAAPRVDDFALRGSRLSFSSPAVTGVPENDSVFAEHFPVAANGSPPGGGPAGVVLSQ